MTMSYKETLFHSLNVTLWQITRLEEAGSAAWWLDPWTCSCTRPDTKPNWNLLMNDWDNPPQSYLQYYHPLHMLELTILEHPKHSSTLTPTMTQFQINEFHISLPELHHIWPDNGTYMPGHQIPSKSMHKGPRHKIQKIPLFSVFGTKTEWMRIHTVPTSIPSSN